MWVVSLALLSLIAACAGQTVADHDQVVACYVSTWAVYRPAKGQFKIENVNPTLCTHVIYAFIGIEDLTYRVKSLDPEFDVNKGGFEKAISLKQRNPKLKVTVAVGGWIEGSEKYSAMASTAANRKVFIDSVIEFIQQHNFDGLDLDWEYPANRGGKPHDKENFVILCKELSEAFSSRNWILTAAVGASRSVVDSAYDLPRLAMYLDFIHLMSYDYHGKWDLKTGHNAPLYPRADESLLEGTLNVNASVRYYLSNGVPLNKFVLGLGVYGRTFLLNDTSNPGIGAPSMKSAFSGPYTREDGFLGYNEICEKQTSERGWSIAWQSAHQAPYMFKDKMWVSFDDTNSLGLKVAYAQRLGIAGVMVWSIDTDDFRGECGQQRFPLLRSINRNMALHAPNRFEEKISTTTKAPMADTTRTTGAPLPDIRPTPERIPIPHPTPEHTPSSHPTAAPLPPTRPTGVPLPDIPSGHPHQPEMPHHDHDHTHHHHPTHHEEHDDMDDMDDLDKDKPGFINIDFTPEQGNELDDSRYYPAEEHEGHSAVSTVPFYSQLSLSLLAVSCLYL